ncbi:MAG: response regulator [Proteobacteria bacterium]|nr:response regulator [Pseudomonadota bacterium]
MPRILVIDDESGIRSVIQTVLQREGHSVRCANDGKAGLAAFEQNKPDLVITDIIMPEKEGIETIQTIRKLDPLIPIIAISGGGRAANADFLPLAAKFGATATLAKPFGAAALLDVVRSVLPASGH